MDTTVIGGFDTLSAANALEKAGFNREQAEVLSHTMARAQGDLATKAGLAIVQADVDAVKSDVATLRREVDTVKSDVAALRREVDTVKSDVATVKSDVTALRREVDTVKSDVAAVKSDVAALRREVDAVRSEVSSLRTLLLTVFLPPIAAILGVVLKPIFFPPA